jgi:hypothetical protein
MKIFGDLPHLSIATIGFEDQCDARTANVTTREILRSAEIV